MTTAATAPERRSRSERRRTTVPPIVAELRTALEQGDIGVLFQPQFAADDGRLVGAEALSRWTHPGLGVIGGDRLFAIAEQGGLTEALSHRVARTALAAARSWRAGLRLSLNVAATDVLAADFVSNIAAMLAEARFSPACLTLEITEQVLLSDLGDTADKLRHLGALGVRIALDDFGAGFCNFDYLKRLPLHALKLDRAMVEGIDSDPRDLVVLRGIVAMAKGLGLEVIAEGVEREGQRLAIVREGCTSWQGFLGAEPISRAEFASLASRAGNAAN